MEKPSVRPSRRCPPDARLPGARLSSAIAATLSAAAHQSCHGRRVASSSVVNHATKIVFAPSTGVATDTSPSESARIEKTCPAMKSSATSAGLPELRPRLTGPAQREQRGKDDRGGAIGDERRAHHACAELLRALQKERSGDVEQARDKGEKKMPLHRSPDWRMTTRRCRCRSPDLSGEERMSAGATGRTMRSLPGRCKHAGAKRRGAVERGI